MPPPTEMPRKEKPLSEVKISLPQRLKKEAIAETSDKAPPVEFVTIKLVVVSVITPASMGKRNVSVEPSPQKGKKKESNPIYEELEETSEEMGSSSGGIGSE